MNPQAISTPSLSFMTPRFNKGQAISMISDDMKAKAEVYRGDETCREKFRTLLTEIGFPNNLLTVDEIEEYGYVEETGFVWLKHKKKRDYYKFENILICYDTEVTAYFEHNKIKNLTGVKAREFLIWITLSEIYVKDNRGKHAASITFKTPAGLSKSFPLSLFQFDEDMKGITEGDA